MLERSDVLWPPWGCETEVHVEDQQTMVRPAFSTAHGPRSPHIPPVPLPKDGVVKYMPVFGAKVHPRLLWLDRRMTVVDVKAMSGAVLQQKETVAVPLAHTVFSHHSSHDI